MIEDPKYQSGDPPNPPKQTDEVIISSDTLRANRIPRGQSRTRKWPVLQAGLIPSVDPDNWTLSIEGLVRHPKTLSLEQFRALPRVKVFSDFHCVTRWSRLGNLWEGVSARTLLDLVEPDPSARYVLIHGADNHWTTNLTLDDFAAEDVLLADFHDGEPLNAEHGGPVRLVVPRLFAWKSAKWITRIEFLAAEQIGFWEQQGYHHRGDPWIVNDQHPDGERFEDPSHPPEGAE